MSWVDRPLVSPDVIEDILLDTVRAHHVEHLAAHERRRGLTASTLEPLATISHLAASGSPLSGDDHPYLLLGWAGTREIEENELGSLDLVHIFGVEVSVIGQSRRDTLRRRDQTAWALMECLLQRTPRDGPVASLSLVDAEPLTESDAQRVRGAVRFLLDVRVDAALAVRGLPPADEGWAPGEPGGGPVDPYDLPVPLPPASDVGASYERMERG